MKLSARPMRIWISISLLIAVFLLSMYLLRSANRCKIPERAIFVRGLLRQPAESEYIDVTDICSGSKPYR